MLVVIIIGNTLSNSFIFSSLEHHLLNEVTRSLSSFILHISINEEYLGSFNLLIYLIGSIYNIILIPGIQHSD